MTFPKFDYPIFTVAGPALRDLPDIDALYAAELHRELARRRDLYPRMQRDGRMSDDEAAAQIGVVEAMIADVEGRYVPDGEGPDGQYDWTAKIHALRRELNLRRSVYPAQVKDGCIDRATADRQLRLLEALHARYWGEGWWMTGGLDAVRAFNEARDAWARDQGYDIDSIQGWCAQVLTGDWSIVPKRRKAA